MNEQCIFICKIPFRILCDVLLFNGRTFNQMTSNAVIIMHHYTSFDDYF